jgi:hypothetical protein
MTFRSSSDAAHTASFEHGAAIQPVGLRLGLPVMQIATLRNPRTRHESSISSRSTEDPCSLPQARGCLRLATFLNLLSDIAD